MELVQLVKRTSSLLVTAGILAAPAVAQAGIPVTIAGTSGDDEIEIIDGVLSLNGADLDLTQFNDGFDYDITVNCGDGNDWVWIDGVDGVLSSQINLTINGGAGEDSIVNYDTARSVSANGGGGIDACAENVSKSNCEIDEDLAGLGAAWDYDEASDTFSLWGTTGADQIAVFNLFSVGFYLFNGSATGLGEVLFAFGAHREDFPIAQLDIYGRKGPDEIWVMPGAHADIVNVYAGMGEDEVTVMGIIASGDSVFVDGGRNGNDSCYHGENDLHYGSYTLSRCENTGFQEFTDFAVQ